MKTLFDVLTNFEGDAEEFHDQIEILKLMDVFGNIYAVYPNKKDARKAILYILFVYSVDSTLHLLREQISNAKQRASEHVDLPESMHDQLVDFKFTYHTKATKRKATKSGDREEVDAIPEDDGIEELEADSYAVDRIITTIDNFLKYQNDPIFSNIIRKKDHYDQVSAAAHRMHMKGKDGSIDWKLKMDLNDQADKLLAEIQEQEAKLLERNKDIAPAIKDFGEKKRKVMNTVRIEHAI